MIINIYLCGVIFFVLAIVLPTAIYLLLKDHEKLLKILTIILFVIYLGLLFVGTTANVGITYPNATINFDFSKPWLSMHFIAFGFGKVNILINLILFIPLGYVVFTFSKKHAFAKTIIIAFLMSVTIELYQWILPIWRNTEIFDVILNTFSGLISASYCYFLSKFGAFGSKKSQN